MNYYRTFSKIYQQAAKKMCFDCADFIEKGSKILDLGCGSGIVAKNFQDFFKSEVLGVDIQDNRIFPIPFKIVAEKNLPFPENYFDTVLISFVLHHCQDPISRLKEAKRVTKNKIIIYEDLAEGFLSNFFCKIHELTFNNFFQKNNRDYNFKKNEEWRKIFEKLKLKIIFEKEVSTIPVKKKLFVLEKGQI